MSESMSSPWIRDYLLDVAETYGAQIYDAPASSGKKKVQLTDFLTYQENSYVWAWMSDKDYRVSVRISKDAAGLYESTCGRNILSCRFSVVFISKYRPMFSPRPLGPNTTGNTSVSHISLEICHVKLIGIGGHLFGNPRDLESDESMRAWVLGLRQDGGGGNVLKLRKQEDIGKNKKILPSPPSPPPFSLYAPVSQCEVIKTADNIAKPKPERPQDFRRAYAKRWRGVDANPWKFATKPAAEEPPNLFQPSPHHTPSPTSRPQQQGTPTDWSPSNRGSPVAPDDTTMVALEGAIRQHDEPGALPTTSDLLSDPEGHATVDIAITSDTHSLQPPTPAQRIRHSLPPRSNSPSPSRPSPVPSQQLPCFSPPPLSPSLPLPSSSLPISMNIRKNIQRKVPHPGLSVPRPDLTKQGPVQILVPNSDTSGAGSSQSHSQSQYPSQPQQYQHQLLSYSPAFPSSLGKDFEPPDASTPREGKPGSSTRRTSKMFAESFPTHCSVDEDEIVSTDDMCITEKADTGVGKQEELDSTPPPAPSVLKIEKLEVRIFDPEEETGELPMTHDTARTETHFDKQAETQDMGEGGADADQKGNELSVDEVEVKPGPQNSPPPTTSVVRHASSNEQGTGGVSTLPVRPRSRSSMHSLFSGSLENERSVSSRTPPLGRTGAEIQEKVILGHVPRHDPETWKEPSFIARDKGKGKDRAVEEPDKPSVKVGKKRRHSVQRESSAPKRDKVAAPEIRQTTSGQATAKSIRPPDVEASVTGKICSSNRLSRSSTDATDTTPSTAFHLSKPRLANFAVNFERIDLGKRVPTPMVDLDKDIRRTLLRTGRIRTLGKDVEKDGRVYLMR